MEKLKGPFKDILPLFIQMKKSSGYKYLNISNYIELDNHLYNNNITNLENTKAIFNVCVTNEKNINRKKQRYYCLKKLSSFMIQIGMKSLYLEEIYFNKNNFFTPRILEEKEIILLFKKIDEKSKKYTDERKYIFPVLFRLVYSSGLRIGEVLHLSKANYNKDLGTLCISLSKNNITRTIPISNSMKKALDKYLELTKEDEDKLFFNISYERVKDFFDNVIHELLMEPCRIHDLRHTFAVITMNKNIDDYNQHKILYLLHIYMGHSNINSTEYYLRLTKRHYKKINNKMKKTNKNIFSKVGVESEK